MGPTNVALVKLLKADTELRAAVRRYEQAAKNVRIQERRIADLSERLKLAHAKLQESQAHAANQQVEIDSAEERIERLRTQQQNARNNKEYQAFLAEINTRKIDQTKVKEDKVKTDQQVAASTSETHDLQAQLDEERKRHEETKSQLSGKLAELQRDIDALKPVRDRAAAAVPPRAREAFERLAEGEDDEAMAALAKPDRRREEYICTMCNMSLVVDVYNRLHSRDDLVFCPSCHRILYIPDDLPPEAAIGNTAPKKEKPAKAAKAPRAPRAKKTSAPAAEPSASTGQPQSLENVLTASQGESVKGAMDADHAPMEAEVWIDERLAGVYKGKSAEHLERVIKFRLGEAGLNHQVRVSARAAEGVAEAAAESAPAEAPVVPPASSETPVTEESAPAEAPPANS